ncbi:MAG: NAD(P)H-dependent oxidoreductase [Gammaproteobacteria bacterium]|nr:NAD(P)H-dependent oxidoreductase [Gammaproteobacteria bacterium]
MKFLAFLGSTRDSEPPAPPRLGLRVARACVQHLQEHQPDHDVELIDPLEFELGAVFKPHFAYARGKAPAPLQTLAEKITEADGYLMVSPEYNHSMSPALAHLLNHFGSSLFSWKPSVIVTYSAGQWGGARAAVAMRTFLSELGCLPVSAMVQVPRAQEVFTEDGGFAEGVDGEAWSGYMDRGLAQLEWWADAAAHHREKVDPQRRIGAFRSSPSQRNAPD